MNRYLKLFFCFLAVISLSCSSGKKNKKLIIDVKDIELKDFKVLRFEKDVFGTPISKLKDSLSIIKKRYGSFYDMFYAQIITAGNRDQSDEVFNLMRFAGDKDMLSIYAETKKVFPDFSGYQNQINDAFKHYKYYFPKKNVPIITTCITGFYYPMMALDSILAISLDFYLGSNYENYMKMGYPLYRVNRMRPEYLVPDCMRAWAMSEYPNKNSKNDLISDMIYQGKILYFCDAMIPEMEDSLKMGYSSEEMEWCSENEANIWAFFIEKKLLYNTNVKDIKKYTSDGPFTATISKKSPSRIGSWTGWQIVRSYMEKNKKVTLEQLMVDNDTHKILSQSGYKPKR